MFLNAIMLAGLAGAAVPLVLHLLNRARFRTVNWGAMMFLLGDDARQLRSTRLKQAAILAIRMAIVAVLAMALARPVVEGRLPAAQAGAQTVVILLDRSASMGLVENGRARMEPAREAVLQILATLDKGDRAGLVLMGDTASARPYQTPSSDLSALASYVSGLDSGLGEADIGQGLSMAADLLDRDANTNQELIVVSDRQATSWRSIDSPFVAAWAKRWAATARRTPRLLYVPVGTEESENAAIDGITVLNPPAIRGRPVDLLIRVRNYGRLMRSALPIRLTSGPDRLLDTEVTVGPGSVATVRATFRFPQTGPHLLSAQLTAGGLSSDSRFDYELQVIDPIPVLLVSGDDPVATTAANAARLVTKSNGRDSAIMTEADFVRAALRPFEAAGHDGVDLATVTVVDAAGAWGDFDSSKYRVVILADVPRFSLAQARALEQHVYGGGGLLVLPAALAQTANYNELLYRDGNGLLPAAIAPATSDDGSASTTISWIDPNDRVFDFVRDRPAALPQALVRRYFPAVPRAADAHVVAQLASGKPFLVEGGFGRGRVLLATSALDDDWGTLPMSGFFLPMVQSSVCYLSSSAIADRNLNLGEPLVAIVDGPVEGPYVVRLPDGTDAPYTVTGWGDQAEVRFDRTQMPGEYTLNVARGRSLRFVVHAPPEESDLSPLSDQRLHDLETGLGMQVVERDSEGNLSDAVAHTRASHEMWGTLLAGVLVLATVEMGLSRFWSRA